MMLVGCCDIIVLAVIVVDDDIVVVVAVVAFICCSNEIDMTKHRNNKNRHHNWDHLQSSNLKAHQTKTVSALTAAMLDFGAARQRDEIGRAFTRLPRRNRCPSRRALPYPTAHFAYLYDTYSFAIS
jgi:hypothetical protein